MSGLSAKRSATETVRTRHGSGLPTVVGITGGIGSGKSTIARVLAARGYTVYDCDKEAKRIIAGNKDVQKKIIDLLGEEAFTIIPSFSEADQSIIYNTSYVAKRVFAEPSLLAQLNGIVHPAVKEDILHSFIPSFHHSAKRIIFIESAILFEAGLDTICDKIFIVEAPEDTRIARTIARDYNGDASPANINKVRARIHAQRPTSCTLHPTPYTIHLTPYTLHPTPYTLHPTPYTLPLTPCPLHHTPHIILNDGSTPIDDLASLILKNI